MSSRGDDRRPLVLTTRPEPAATALAERLETLGYAAIAAPCLVERRVSRAAPDDFTAQALDGVAALTLTSAAAARALSADIGPARLAEIADRLPPVYCVGAATAAAARAAGMTAIVEAGGDGAALETALILALPAGATAWHLRGEDVAHDLRPGLAAAGVALRETILYRTEAATDLPAAATSALSSGGVDAALFLSARTAAAFVSLAPATAGFHAVCISARAAAPLRTWRAVTVAERPTLDAVVEMLQRVTPPFVGPTRSRAR